MTALHPPRATVSRRALVAGSGAAGLAFATTAHAQVATPATPAAVDPAAFRALCVTVTGVTDPAALDDDGLAQLLALFQEDEQMTAALHDLLAMDLDSVDLRGIDFSYIVVITNILQFWYLGNFRNAPLENRADRLPRLVSWQALPYVTTPDVCKSFGYWALDVEVSR